MPANGTRAETVLKRFSNLHVHFSCLQSLQSSFFFNRCLYFSAMRSEAKTAQRLCNLTHSSHLSAPLAHNCFNKCEPSQKCICDSDKKGCLTFVIPLTSVWSSLTHGALDLFFPSFTCNSAMLYHLSRCPNGNKIVDQYRTL